MQMREGLFGLSSFEQKPAYPRVRDCRIRLESKVSAIVGKGSFAQIEAASTRRKLQVCACKMRRLLDHTRKQGPCLGVSLTLQE